MVEKHGITPEVADYHVRAMTDTEVKSRTRAALQSILDEIARRWHQSVALVCTNGHHFRGERMEL